MTNIRFEWDENKNLANQRQHKVSFSEAKTVFCDENARLIPDPDHSTDEDRFILLGYPVIYACWLLFIAIEKMMKLPKSSQHEKQLQMNRNITSGGNKMRNEYDFSKSIKNPYIKKLKRQITIRLESETIEYFKQLAIETDIPYHKLINLFLRIARKIG